MRLTPADLADLARWNYRQLRARNEYAATLTSVDRSEKRTACPVCGGITEAKSGVHRGCAG